MSIYSDTDKYNGIKMYLDMIRDKKLSLELLN